MEARSLFIGVSIPKVGQEVPETTPNSFFAAEHLLPLYLSLIAQEQPELRASMEGEYRRSSLPPRSAQELDRYLERTGFTLSDSNLAGILRNLADETAPNLYFDDLRNLAHDFKTQGRLTQAYLIFQYLEQLGSQEPFSDFVAATDITTLQEEIRLIDGRTDSIPWTRRLGHHLETMDAFVLADDVSLVGANLGVVTILASLFRPLRPMAALGVKFLSKPMVSAALITASSLQLYHQLPEASAAWLQLNGNSNGTGGSRFQSGLFLGSYLLHGVSTLIGMGSFVAGAHRFHQYRRWALSQGYTPAHAGRVGLIYADAARRAFEDPLIWAHWGGAGLTTASLARPLVRGTGLWTHRFLMGGSVLVGGGQFFSGMAEDRHQENGITWSGTLSRILYLGLDLSPASTMILYRAGRGNRHFDLGPALSQEMTESHYNDPSLRAKVLDRIDEGLFPLDHGQEWQFIQQGQVDLNNIRASLQAVSELKPLSDPLVSHVGADLNRFSLELSSPQQRMSFSPEALYPQWNSFHLGRELAEKSLAGIHHVYSEGRVAPSGVLQLIWRHQAIKNSAIFPRRLDQGALREQLYTWARQSDERFQRGGLWVRPLEGIFVAVKDLFPGSDGIMMMGSKTSRMVGVGESPMMMRLRELGAIPFPVGMVAAANGGSGMHAGFGYIPHPTRSGFDPAGSSSGTAHVVGLKGFPVSIGIGTDTGGSVIAPAGAVGLHAWVPPGGYLSTKNMVPFDTALDRVGVLSQHPQDAINMVRLLRQEVIGDPHLTPLNEFSHVHAPVPQIVYLESMLRQSSPEYVSTFHQHLERLREQGVEIRPLGKNWDFLTEVPLKLYPLDAYGAAAFTFTNPQRAPWGEPPRRTLDHNLQIRLSKGALAIKYGLFDEARNLSALYREEVRRLLGDHVVLAAPSPEAIRTSELVANRAGSCLDQHDRITMAKNRIPWWGQFHFRGGDDFGGGISLSGSWPGVESLVHRLEHSSSHRESHSFHEPMAAQ